VWRFGLPDIPKGWVDRVKAAGTHDTYTWTSRSRRPRGFWNRPGV